MTLDDAILEMIGIIRSACATAEVKTVKMSDEEARLSVYAPAAEMERINVATFQPAINLLNNEGLDIQVFVYEKM